VIDTTGPHASGIRPSRREGLHARRFDDEIVLYDAAHHGVHYLNQTAAMILELCDGTRDERDLVNEMQRRFGTSFTSDQSSALAEQVRYTLERLTADGLIESSRLGESRGACSR
jgi:PqqD family protein of HPr-rel-A system